MRKIIATMLIIISALLLTACACEHEWSEATCTEPQICSLCEETQGEALGHTLLEPTCTEPKRCANCDLTEGKALGHTWQDATCETAKTCSTCGTTEDEALGHNWQDATCEVAKTCSTCAATEGEALGHTWQDATCEVPKTCSACEKTDGEALGHNVEKWSVTKEATCVEKGTEEGLCSVCQETVTKEIDLTEHTEGEWEVTKEATASSKGEKSIKCTVCEEVLKTETFELTPEEIEANYKDKCEKYSYDKIARSPGKYEGKYARYYGKVIQVMQSKIGSYIFYTLRIGTGGSYYYDDVIYATYIADEDDPRILEDDRVTIYGELMGEYTYETVMGNEITLPRMSIQYIDFE